MLQPTVRRMRVLLVALPFMMTSCSSDGDGSFEPSPQVEWRVTSAAYAETAPLPEAVTTELGAAYRVADWNDLATRGGNITALLDQLGVATGEILLLTHNGERWAAAGRHYFLQRGPAHAGALVHAQFGSTAWLGSWGGYTGLRILAVKR